MKTLEILVGGRTISNGSHRRVPVMIHPLNSDCHMSLGPCSRTMRSRLLETKPQQACRDAAKCR